MDKIALDKSTADKLYTVNFDSPILSHYEGVFDSCFVILHPFYSHPFADDYNYLSNYELTYPLIRRITRQDIIKKTKIKDFDKLALTITYDACDKNFQSSVESEHSELGPFLNEEKIKEPYWDEDKIPEDIVLKFLTFLKDHDYVEVFAGNWMGSPNEPLETVTLRTTSLYNQASMLGSKSFIVTPDSKYCLKLPYYDLPYTFLLTRGISKTIVDDLNLEGFYATSETKTYWFV